MITGAENWSKEEGFSARPHVLASSIAASLLDRPDKQNQLLQKVWKQILEIQYY